MLGADRDPVVRSQAAGALGRLGGPRVAAALKTALRDPAPSVRCQAVTAVLRVQREAAARGLRGLLESDPDPRIRRITARALGSLRAEEALRALEAARSDPDESVRHEVTRILKCIGAAPIALETHGPSGGCRDIPTLRAIGVVHRERPPDGLRSAGGKSGGWGRRRSP